MSFKKPIFQNTPTNQPSIKVFQTNDNIINKENLPLKDVNFSLYSQPTPKTNFRNVHKNNQKSDSTTFINEINEKNEEIASLKSKIEQLESEKSEFQIQNEKYEQKIDCLITENARISNKLHTIRKNDRFNDLTILTEKVLEENKKLNLIIRNIIESEKSISKPTSLKDLKKNR